MLTFCITELVAAILASLLRIVKRLHTNSPLSGAGIYQTIARQKANWPVHFIKIITFTMMPCSNGG